MAGLWTGIALLTLCALGIVLLPLLRARRLQQQEVAEDRDRQNIDIYRERLSELEEEKALGNLAQPEFDELKLELERSLLQDVGDTEAALQVSKVSSMQVVTVSVMALLLVVSALGLYAKLGSAPRLELALERQAGPDPFDGRTPTLEEALSRLEHELEVTPENVEGWYLLATTYMGAGRFDDGIAAFKQLLARLPEDAPQYTGVMGQYAQALYFANGGKMNEQVREQVTATLQRNPGEITALGLLGIDAFEQQRYAEAIDFWSRALAQAEPSAAESLRAGISRAQQELRALGEPVPEVAGIEPAEIRLAVRLAEGLGTALEPDQAVFIFARPVGGRMPLAAVKLKVSDLPLEVVLDDTQAMTPQARLSGVDEVEVGARISLTGTPEPKTGDLFAILSPVSVRGQTQAIDLVIDQVVE
ncbi:c-type cytochrome biogenesis protein CcmI [Marinobacterium sedimentorum]|uniref:c-type cytochrome biogenesis protein CcmI n=1 Tax=Marinobacterium sedimentorum TaxID=2927804 RepID=UPI0020C5D06F|nr:c-type cytochrome biogenesis protein CcmI [Marinobacterium sedimentorum]MCP8689390.1 c-type cytochrome biogenesis protein CcmI [Marinobacterium sedimentorum]